MRWIIEVSSKTDLKYKFALNEARERNEYVKFCSRMIRLFTWHFNLWIYRFDSIRFDGTYDKSSEARKK